LRRYSPCANRDPGIGDIDIHLFKLPAAREATSRALIALLLLCLAWGMDAAEPPATADPMVHPPELARDIAFWTRVYTEISTNEGFLHDENDLGIVYRTLKFNSDVTPRERRDAVDEQREKLVTMLKHLASGTADLSDDELRITQMFGNGASPDRFREAAQHVRFQLGQADRFREGLERSGAWEQQIAAVFANAGLPTELAALPHVESSFDPAAYSKVGAAGLWQFMPGTGRRFLRVNDAVDERLDPYRATEAAAQLMEFNYRLLGSWPLAVTAYNHGAEGMRRARDSMGTSDIATIARNYHSPSFGFASRNFYVSFLAALEIDRNPDKYFGNLSRHVPLRTAEVEMPSYVPLAALQRALKIDRAQLAALNPALRPTVWEGRRLVPMGYRLRLPAELGTITTAQLAKTVGPMDQYTGQPRPRSYRVKSGDTLAHVAQTQGVDEQQLARLNNLGVSESLKGRRILQLPDIAPARIGAAGSEVPALVAAVQAAPPATAPALMPETAPKLANAPAPAPAPAAVPPVTTTAPTTTPASRRAPAPEPLTRAQARAESPSLAPGGASGAVAQVDEGVEFAVATNGTIRVAADETLGHYAQWLNLPTSRLRSINGLRGNATVSLGRSLKMDFSKVTAEQFEQQRREFHQSRQSDFFKAHRIVGTEVYVARKGDSLWVVTQRYASVPTWLLQHYNPDVNFSDLHAGVEIVIPKVEALPPA
jgi:membrane-bound lytic murein transglycosylase D